jgi:hypothetical protein
MRQAKRRALGKFHRNPASKSRIVLPFSGWHPEIVGVIQSENPHVIACNNAGYRIGSLGVFLP